ncbi:uncharacterized protein LOC116222910 [Clupea harengus]|uniref:Uncharacterized protein LOC116222910 n=1 Tax=Clupea harengus TaxID=7950 RepID=A0A6P8G3Y6_CLUHA|nr:uncharacterized protein LOC116222910 [Clupea harengus]
MNHQTAFNTIIIHHDNIVSHGPTTGIFRDPPLSSEMQVETGQSPVSLHSGFLETSYQDLQTGSEVDLVHPGLVEARPHSFNESGTSKPEVSLDQSRDQFIQGMTKSKDSSPTDTESIVAVQNLMNDDFSSNHTGSIKRLAVVQHFLTTCQRLRDLCNGCSGFRVSFFGRQPELSSARVAVSSGVQSCGNIKDTGTSGCADLTTAIDAMDTVMGRMVLNLDDAAAIRMKMEQLLSSGTLRPLTDMLVNRLRHIIPEYDCPQEKFVYAIVERPFKR